MIRLLIGRGFLILLWYLDWVWLIQLQYLSLVCFVYVSLWYLVRRSKLWSSMTLLLCRRSGSSLHVCVLPCVIPLTQVVCFFWIVCSICPIYWLFWCQLDFGFLSPSVLLGCVGSRLLAWIWSIQGWLVGIIYWLVWNLFKEFGACC